MKTAVVAYYFPVVSETFVINHVNSLIESGHEVTVFSFNPKPPATVQHPQWHQHNLAQHTVYGTGLPKSFLHRIRLFTSLFYRQVIRQKKTGLLSTLNIFRFGKDALSLKLFLQAQLFLRQNEFDIIHCHFGNAGNDVQKLQQAGLLKGKIVVSFHGVELRDESIVKSNKGYAGVFQYCHRIVANSGYTYRQLAGLGCPPQKLVTVPVAASDLFQKTNRHHRRKAPLFTVLTIARLDEVKGHCYSIEAIRILKEKYNLPVAYHLVGDGALRPALEKQVAELQLQDSITFFGARSQDQLPAYLSACDVFLLPSLLETQGLVLIEAQMMELPVVASNTGGIPDSMVDGETGLLVPPKDPEAIAEALYKLYANQALRTQFGKAGKKFAAENFSASSITARMNATYRQLLKA